MCGIVAYLGKKEAYPILIKGLHRLEYRGYDSAGICLSNNANLVVYKNRGKVSDLEDLVKDVNLSGHIGIAHTRWATHGAPNQCNAHPHYSENEDLAIIHNGIIENYSSIKQELAKEGRTFHSDTDTEVLIQLIDYIRIKNEIPLSEAVHLALSQVVGAYAIAIISRNDPDTIIAARKGSPLVIGIGDGEFFLASDATPIVEHTRKVIYLEDGDIAEMRLLKDGKSNLEITNLENVVKTPPIQQLEMNLSMLEKGGFEHFMLKEIYEQSRTVRDCLRGRVNAEQNNVALSGIIDHKDKFLNARRIIITACGTSWHAALVGEYILEELLHVPVEVEYSSEFRYRDTVVFPDDVVIAISQSGETADTLAAIEKAKENGAFVYGICNVVGSSIPRATHSGTYTHVGPEIGVASTKAFTAQVCVLALIALCLAREKKTISEERYIQLIGALCDMPLKIEETLKLDEKIHDFSKIFTYSRNFLYLGRGYNYPLALEGALKLKEISYIHAEGYPAAEMKHGPIALIDAEMPVLVIATNRGSYDKIVSNIQEVKARKGRIISVVTEGDEAVRGLSDFCISIPETEEMFVPILASIPLQLLAYHIAVLKGCNVDQPRNLAKSVTVE
ncbi:MAG: glutamine--fructose-6-phosphate transaminase (isomerizing) [Bacteroidales bacterium]|jgi:glucosamine--fructose-6-phosphate aminotransferase (isomerizing)|nr:glutamine--fructose-6-phosphate transaminase (isomerizing) [Bacteroidales bacterium]